MAHALIGRYLRYALFFAAAVALAALLSRRSSGPKTDMPAPEFELSLADSEARFSLISKRGKPVLVEAFASWCSACRSAAPRLAEAARAARERDVEFVAISVDDSREAAQRVKRAWDIPYAVAMDDGTFSRNYKITLLPTFVLIDAEGRVRRVSTGVPGQAELEGWLSEVGAARR